MNVLPATVLVVVLLVWYLRDRFDHIDKRFDQMDERFRGEIATLGTEVATIRSDLLSVAVAFGQRPPAA